MCSAQDIFNRGWIYVITGRIQAHKSMCSRIRQNTSHKLHVLEILGLGLTAMSDVSVGALGGPEEPPREAVGAPTNHPGAPRGPAFAPAAGFGAPTLRARAKSVIVGIDRCMCVVLR
jgi:hypothetical protein